MKLRLMALLLLAPSLAFAQDVAEFNKGLNAFNTNDFATAARSFYGLAESSSDAEVKQKPQYSLARALASEALPAAAVIYDAEILKSGKEHPYYLKAVEA